MRPITFNFPTETAVEICATNVTAASGSTLALNGGLSNIAQINSAGYIPAVTLPGIARTIQISSTGNISTSTFSFTGLDIRGVAVSTSIAGPTGLLIPTHTTQEFHVILTASVGNTAATSSFTIGVGATGSSGMVMNSLYANPFNMAVTVITGTSQPVTIQDSQDNANDTSVTPTWINHATLVTVTTNSESNYAYPARFTRAIFVATAVAAATSSATTAAAVTFIQAG